MSWVFVNGPVDRVQSQVDSKIVLDIALLNTQHYKVMIKGKMNQSKECSSALSYTSVW